MQPGLESAALFNMAYERLSDEVRLQHYRDARNVNVNLL